jgi:hypothetical protein
LGRRLEQKRPEQERLELRRIQETLEREDLQERSAQASQAQGNLEQEKQRQQEQESESKKGRRRGYGSKRLVNKGGGNKSRQLKILSELESVTPKLIWRALSLPRAKHKNVNYSRQVVMQGKGLQARIYNRVENWW